MKFWLVLPLLLACTQPGSAQVPVPAQNNQQTTLHLSETGRVIVRPDELVATLRATATGTGAAGVQGKINTAMQTALARAHALAAITASTGFYQVWRVNQTDQWHAEQALTLRAHDAPVLLELVGNLQGLGLASSGLSWMVTPELARSARAEATNQALSALRARADEAAAIVGLSFISFRDIRLDGASPQPFAPRMMAAMSASADPKPPSAEAEDVTIETSVSADVLLGPKS